MQTWMKNSVFDRHFEFSNFTDVKQSHRQISLSYSYSAGNLAIENTRFQKKYPDLPNPNNKLREDNVLLLSTITNISQKTLCKKNSHIS